MEIDRLSKSSDITGRERERERERESEETVWIFLTWPGWIFFHLHLWVSHEQVDRVYLQSLYELNTAKY
jgi:hypothetical protein